MDQRGCGERKGSVAFAPGSSERPTTDTLLRKQMGVHCALYQMALAGIMQKCPLSTIFLSCGRDGDERWVWVWLETEPSSPKVFRKRQLSYFYFYNLFAAFVRFTICYLFLLLFSSTYWIKMLESLFHRIGARPGMFFFHPLEVRVKD